MAWFGQGEPITGILKRILRKPNWYNLRSVRPISRVFGLDRGRPIDRYYIEQFLDANRAFIKGTVMEIAENTYTQKFGTDVTKSEILHYDPSFGHATIIGDLSKPDSLPPGVVDCFICTQTMNFVFDVHAAVSGIHHMLKNDGVVLATMAGVCQISRYDMERWGDYWRFTTRSAERLFGEVFGKENVVVGSFGNVLSCVAFLEGLAFSELQEEELNYRDDDYQLVVTIVARKNGPR